MIRGKYVKGLLALAIVLSSQTISWAAEASNNKSVKLPVSIGVNHYKIFDKDGNSTQVSFVYNKDDIEVIVQPPDDSDPEVIVIPKDKDGGPSKGGKGDKDKGGGGDYTGIIKPTPPQTGPGTIGTVKPGGSAYTDISSHWARNDIMLLSVMGIMKGYPDGTFRPDGKITKAEFAALLERVMDKTTKLKPAQTSAFLDVPPNAWFTPSVSRLEGHGNINLSYYPDRTLHPNLSIPRQEMVAWMAADVGDSNQNIVFTDENSITYLREVKKIAGAKVVQGFPDGTFRPNGVTTRAEAASVMVRFMKLKGLVE